MSNSPAPRQDHSSSRSLRLPSSFHENSLEEDGRRDSGQDATNYESHISRLSPPFSERLTVGEYPPSHFSPSTPAVEKGFGRYVGGKNGMYRGSPDGKPGAPCQCGHGKRKLKNNILLVVSVAFVLVLITNVIFLDVRMMSTSPSSGPFNRQATIHQGLNSTASGPSSPFPLPSSSPSTSLRSSSTPLPSQSPVLNSVNIAASSDISPQSTTCISQFFPGAPTPQDPTAYCTQCMPALQNVPGDWFVKESSSDTQGRNELQALSNAMEFCNNTTPAGSNGPAPSTSM